jgi:hypothetical protein
MHHRAMTRSLVASSFVLMAVASVTPGCSSDDDDSDKSSYTGDALKAIRAHCEQRMASQSACSSKCTLAGLNAKCPESDPMWGDAELTQYHDCRDTCPTSRSCDDGKKFYDCECAQTCASQRSKKLQGLMAYNADCQITLAECQ